MQRYNVEIPDDDFRYLQTCARIRRVSTIQLVKRLIRIIAQEQLVLSVLDDDSQPFDIEPEVRARYNRSKLFDCV